MTNHFNLLNLEVLPERLYHYTHKNNLRSIYLDGKLKANIINEVFLTPTLLDARKFAIVYSILDNIDINNYVVLSFETSNTNIDRSTLSISRDHNKETFLGAEALVHDGDIYININSLAILYFSLYKTHQ